MTPEIDFRDEGNSVDPPSLPTPNMPHSPRAADPQASLSLHDEEEDDAEGNSETFVFESSTTSSRMCVKTFSDVDCMAKMNAFMLGGGTHPTNFSAAQTPIKAVQSSDESNSASPSAGNFGAGVKSLHPLSGEMFSDMQLAQQTGNQPPLDCREEDANSNPVNRPIASVSICNDHEDTPSGKLFIRRDNNAAISEESIQCKEQFSQSGPPRVNQNPGDFNFKTSEVGCRLKPQLKSNFLCEEMGSKPEGEFDVEEILRKYGIETRKYNPSVAMSKYASGDCFRRTSASALYSYKTFVSSGSFSTTSTLNSYATNYSYTPFVNHKDMNVSQNNEALCKLLNPNAEAKNVNNKGLDENIVTLQPTAFEDSQKLAAPESVHGNKDREKGVIQSTILGWIDGSSKHLSLSSNVDRNTSSSKNNDSQENDTMQEERGAQDREEISAVHGSSVDIAVMDRSEGMTGFGKGGSLTPGGSSYSVSQGPQPGNFAGTGLTSGKRTGSFSMSSQPSNMDTIPFEGSYLKHHKSMTKYPSAVGSGIATPDAMLSSSSSAGNSKDFLTPNIAALSVLGSSTDALGYSLQQERYRLRTIDNLITSSPARTIRPYSTMPYMSLHHTPTNSPISLSRRGSINHWWSGTAMSSAASYDTPNDIAMIQRSGSSVDSGQFNNNRGMWNGSRVNKCNTKSAQATGGKKARDKECYERGNIQTVGKTQHQKRQRQFEKQLPPKANSKSSQIIVKSKAAQRNRMVASKKVESNASTNRSVHTQPKTNQRPESAQTRRDSHGSAKDDTQINNSYRSIPNEFEFAKELNRMWSVSVLGEDYVNSKSSNISDPIDHRNGATKNLPASKNSKGIRKYQPYKAKATQRQIQANNGHGINEEMAEPPVSSSGNKSKSQHSIQEINPESNDKEHDVHQYPKYLDFRGISSVHRCNSCKDLSVRSIMEATALASALIRRRQQQQQKSQFWAVPTSCQQKSKATNQLKPAQRGSGQRAKQSKTTVSLPGERPASARSYHSAAATPRTAKVGVRPKSARGL
ncbi:hypothetical protein PoB_004248000 [Plakobranchus ocellatus]|uniref:Uncharacterized protein n=1 Tax=Plakobranchus ocellatus TaxID=259542 RepID=A0AAV4BA50_9GAST|nr:hypothetical protein PoB_004248000 [Plakobranchus ocellatus]